MEQTVENGGHISMDKEFDEKTPLLLPDTTTNKEKKNEGKTSKKEGIYNHLFSSELSWPDRASIYLLRGNINKKFYHLI